MLDKSLSKALETRSVTGNRGDMDSRQLVALSSPIDQTAQPVIASLALMHLPTNDRHTWSLLLRQRRAHRSGDSAWGVSERTWDSGPRLVGPLMESQVCATKLEMTQPQRPTWPFVLLFLSNPCRNPRQTKTSTKTSTEAIPTQLFHLFLQLFVSS